MLLRSKPDRLTLRNPTAAGALEKLRAVVLLGGSVRARHLSAAVGRSVLDLPVDAEVSLLGHWHRELDRLARRIGLESLAVRLRLDRAAPEPAVRSLSGAGMVPVLVERDPFEFRGTGGVMRDVLADYEDDDLVLMGNASQLVLEPVAELAEVMAARAGDVCIVSQEDGAPGSLMLLRCAAVREIAAVGFVDMKEQALPEIARRMRVEVVNRPGVTGLPVRTAGEYLHALGRYHRQLAGRRRPDDPFAEDWEPSFSLVEDGATVAGDALIHDSVVLSGARVGARAVLVRSLVGPGVQVRGGEIRIDEVGGAAGNGTTNGGQPDRGATNGGASNGASFNGNGGGHER